MKFDDAMVKDLSLQSESERFKSFYFHFIYYLSKVSNSFIWLIIDCDVTSYN
jgi:hypothetical protein